MWRQLFYAFIFITTSFGGMAHSKEAAVSIKPDGWYGNNANILSQVIEEYRSPQTKPPVAAFDWDNTVIKNDIGDAVMYWMLAKNKVLQPPNKNWRLTSPLLTNEAVNALSKACSSQGGAGKPLVTNQTDRKSVACADEIFSIYDGGKTVSGASAWRDDAKNDIMEPAYAWTVSLQAGYTPAEIHGFAEETIKFNLGNDIGAVQTVGSKKDVTAYIRIYDPIKNLIEVMQRAGFDAWVVSASAQPIVEAFATRVGIEADHVIAVRTTLDKKGKTTAKFQACGAFSDNNYGVIPYRQGKRCWLNKIVFGEKGATAQMDKRSPLVFGAGDSDTDVHFLKDAQHRLVINRNKPELMCNAYDAATKPAGGRWIINPMFIKPKPKKPEPYDCSKFGLLNQEDSVH